MDDLSKHHQPLGDLFPKPRGRDGWDLFRLSDEQVNHYRENGYLHGVRVLDDQQVAALREELEIFFDPNHDGRELWYEYHANEAEGPNHVLFHALGAWRIKPGFHDALWNPALTVPASQLLGGAVRFWHDQLFCKPAKHGGVVAWHQDYSYWTRTQPIAHLSAWIGLDDADQENGCMYYIPRSHTWNLLPVTGLAGDMDAIQTVLTDQQRADFKPVAVELKAGEASFHHPLLVHGSYENRTERPRRAMVINMVLDGVHSTKNEPLLEGVPAIGAGEPLGGQFFPLLFDPDATAEN